MLHGAEREEYVGLSAQIVEATASRLYHILQGPNRVADDSYLLPCLFAALQQHVSVSPAHHRVGGDQMSEYSATLARSLQAIAIYGSLENAAKESSSTF